MKADMLDHVFVVAGGPSLHGFNFSALNGHDCIVVNKSLFSIPSAKYFVTMDFTFLNKIRLEHKYDQFKNAAASKFFVANFGSGVLHHDRGRIVCKASGLVYDLPDFDVIIKSKISNGFGYKWTDFRSGNCSGYSAVQLAVMLGYQKIYLLGLDLKIGANGKTHYHEGYRGGAGLQARRLAGYFEYFKAALPQVRKNGYHVMSCSAASLLNTIIPVVSVQEALDGVYR